MAVTHQDDFTGIGASSALTNRVAPVGGTWRSLSGSFIGVGGGANRIRNSGTGVNYLDTPVAVSTYAVECDVPVVTDNNATATGVCAYMDIGAGNFYHARVQANGNSVQLYKFTATSTATLLGSAALEGFSAGLTYRLRLEVSPGQQKVYVDGVLRITELDTSLSVAGITHYCGIRGAGTVSDTAGLHIDNFLADNLISGNTQVDSSVKVSLWNIKAPVEGPRTTNWKVNEVVTKEGTGDIDTPFTSGWNVSVDVNVPRSSMWNVAAQTTQARVSSWNVYATVPVSEVTSGLHTSLWAVIGRIEQSQSGLWNVSQSADIELTSLWEVRAEVLQQLLTEWQTFESTEQGLAATWSVLGSIDLELVTEWSIFSASASYDERHFLPPLVAVVFDAVSAGIVSDAVALGNVVDHEATGTPANYEATGTNV